MFTDHFRVTPEGTPNDGIMFADMRRKTAPAIWAMRW